MENGNVSVLVGFEEIEINLKIRTGFEWRIWSGISCTLLYIKKCLWVGSFGVIKLILDVLQMVETCVDHDCT